MQVAKPTYPMHRRYQCLLLYHIGRHYTKVYKINDLPFANNAESELNNTEIAKFDDHFEAQKLMNSYITKVHNREQCPVQVGGFISQLIANCLLYAILVRRRMICYLYKSEMV